MTYNCRICQRKFSTQSGLTRHANTVHHGRTTLSQANKPSRYQWLDIISRPEHDEALWNTLIIRSTLTNNLTSNEDVEMEELSEDVQMQEIESIIEDEPIHRYNLRSQVQNIETEDTNSEPEEINFETEDNSEDSETKIQLPINLKPDFDLEDLQGVSLDDALDTSKEKNKLETIVKWPNDAYRDFMELMVENNISNKTGDKIIKFFNKHSNLENSPLPKSAKSSKDYLNQINSPSVAFKEKVVITYEEVDFKLYYRPIFRAI